MDDKQVQFIPYNAINEFMIAEYRLRVLQSVLSGIDHLPNERRTAINNIIKKQVQVPGFRNSAQAPTGIKAKASVTVFERRADYAGHILQGWSEQRPELRQQVHDFLKGRDWEVLPPDADRTKIPGFLIQWPKGETYDVLGEAFAKAYPDVQVDENDLRLMIVWLAGRLPYDMDDEEETETEAAEE